MGQFSTITQDIKIKLKMKFLIPLLVIFATSDAFFGIGRKSDSRDANPTNIDTEELARLLGEILVKELRNHNNNDHHDDEEDNDNNQNYNNNNNHHHNNKNHHHNNNNRYNNNNTPRPVRPYTPRPVNNNKYNTNSTPRPVHTYTPRPVPAYTPEPVHTYTPEPIVY